MKQTLFALLVPAMLTVACTSVTQQPQQTSAVYNDLQRQLGDSTLYGLACDGCTDSILVFLPYTGGDPDTFNIIEARARRRMLGRPDIGDEIAIVRSSQDSTVADMVINLERLKGEWCYQVVPKLKLSLPSANGKNQAPPTLPDSILKKWLQPREYGINIMRDNVAMPIGYVRPGTDDKQMPVEFPALKLYREWHIFNGHLLLTESRRDTTGNLKAFNTDTTDIVLLRRDSLVLRFKDGEQGYYLRK